MATTTEPWGLTPLTTEGLAGLGHPLSLSDFNKDASGRYWRMIRGQKTFYPREWFDAGGTFTGSGTQSGDRAGQDSGFFHQGMKWNWTTGQWENPTNWANVIGVAAAGGVGAGIAAPAIGAALGGGGAATGGGAGGTAATGGWGSTEFLGPAVEGAGAGGAGAVPAAAATTVEDLFASGSAIPNVGAAGNTLADIAANSGGGGGASSWLTKLLGKDTTIPALANIFGNIYAANKQAGASADALAQQQKQFDEAIAATREEQTYNRNQYGDYLGRLAPYKAAGDDANYREAQYMAQPSASGGFPARSSVAPPAPMQGSGPAADVVPPVRPPGGTTQPATTRLRAPDGTEQDVPTAQVQHYLDQGATVVGNRYTTMGAA
jgi:hypothetical protein